MKKSHIHTHKLTHSHAQESRSGGTRQGQPTPPMWEYANNHALMTFRLYYCGDRLDTNIPAPTLMVNMQSLRNKDRTDVPPRTEVPIVPRVVNTAGSSGKTLPTASKPVVVMKEEPRLTVQEVREHLELLKEFEGVIPNEEIAQRKRDLFMALPAIPAKRNKSDG